MTPRLARVPSLSTEALRLAVVVAGAALGYEVGRRVGQGDEVVLGAFNAAAVGAIVGAGLGYSLGGVIARRTLRAISRGERALDRLAPDEAVAGALGALVVTALVALVAWPLLLFEPLQLTAPVFVFLLLVGSLFGFRAGQHRRQAVADLIAAPAGMAPRVAGASAMPRVLDSSVAIDGRIVDIVRSGFMHGRMLVPMPVLTELQGLADAADDARRAKGLRGLAVLESLRGEQGVELAVIGDEAPGLPEVDAKLIRICLDRSAALLTSDAVLARTAGLAGVRVLNLHQLALAMKPPVAVGDELTVTVRRKGREPGQAVAHLDDGTMVVVERAADRIGSSVPVRIASVIATGGGRMAFAVPQDAAT